MQGKDAGGADRGEKSPPCQLCTNSPGTSCCLNTQLWKVPSPHPPTHPPLPLVGLPSQQDTDAQTLISPLLQSRLLEREKRAVGACGGGRHPMSWLRIKPSVFLTPTPVSSWGEEEAEDSPSSPTPSLLATAGKAQRERERELTPCEEGGAPPSSNPHGERRQRDLHRGWYGAELLSETKG